MDDRDDDLFEDDLPEPEDYPTQDGPDLFGAEPTVDEPADAIIEIADPPTSAALMDAIDARRRPSEHIERPETPLALYRRYRPETFAQVIGQEQVTEPLQRALVNNRVNHAYLFSGPRGCGKTTSARILARCLNCAEGPTPEPCGECQSCRDLARGGTGSIDVIEIDAASHGGVNEARDLRERAFFAPVHSRYKIYIIDEAHMVTKEGFNALLKVVEEPPPHVKFIFATTEPEKVLGTIRSRTHHYPFRLVPPKTLSSYLGELCEAEGIAVEPTVLPLVVRAGAGSVRDSLSVLDQLLGGAAEAGVSYQQATALLGYTPEALLDEIIGAFAAGDAQGVFTAIDKVIETGQDPRRFAEDLLHRLRDLIIISAVPEAFASGLIDVSGDQAERLTTQADSLGSGELTRAAEVIALGLTEMRGTTAPRLHLELMCARVLLPGADAGDRGVHARLDRLERRLSIATAGGAEPEAIATPAPSTPATPAPNPPATTSRPGTAAAKKGARDPWAASGATMAAASPPSATPQPSESKPTPAAAPQTSAPDPTAEPGPAPTPPKAAPTPAKPADPGSLTTADLRSLWPQVLDTVKGRRRFTWILLSQNAQVVQLLNKTLTVGFANDGARDSFSRSSSVDILRAAIMEVVGADVSIELVIDATAADDSAPAPAPAAKPNPVPKPSAAAKEAKANIKPTRSGPSPEEAEPEPDRDDAEIAEDNVDGEELLKKHLGAELIDPT